MRRYKGSLEEIYNLLPRFERRSFSLTQAGGEQTRLNERLDTIVRLPIGDDLTTVPIGVVSKDYQLVPHTAVFESAAEALRVARINLADVTAELLIAEYGERMALSFFLPIRFDPGDGHELTMRLECFNSVDGTTRFQVLMSWFRQVCSNGLVIRVDRTGLFSRRHVGDLKLDEIVAVLTYGIEQVATEINELAQCSRTPIRLDRFGIWTDESLRKKWGFKAATRAFHIARTGCDVDIVGQFNGSAPTNIAVTKTNPVPGAPEQATNLFDLVQVLAWLAKERRDVQEQMQWREDINEIRGELQRIFAEST